MNSPSLLQVSRVNMISMSSSPVFAQYLTESRKAFSGGLVRRLRKEQPHPLPVT